MTNHPVRWLVQVLGALLVWGALGFFGYAAGWTAHKDRAQSVLETHARPAEQAKTSAAPCVQSPPQVGQLAGTLTIPSIGLKAPIEEGTDDAELDVAAGHAPASVWPGATGSAVFLAHDVSYFVHINSLKPGDLIYYQDQCSTVAFQVTGQNVVNAGDPVYNSATPTMILDTCWPTNALFYTTQRLLVTAAEDPTAPPLASHSKSSHTTSSSSGTSPTTTPKLPAADTVSYTVPAPPDLVAQGLTLDQNEAPMGTMTLTGNPSSGWEESPGPLNLTSAGLQAYFGGIHSAEQVRSDWWGAIAPGVAMPAPLANAQITGHDSPLDVTINSVGGVPQSVTMTTDVTVSGGSAPGTYHLVATGGIAGSVVTITSWEMNNA
ncbi:MAG TPA: class D sortase [Acidimicrobiales bacterium]|nr:class D sortase [Acidimicrobiales bacterium]